MKHKTSWNILSILFWVFLILFVIWATAHFQSKDFTWSLPTE